MRKFNLTLVIALIMVLSFTGFSFADDDREDRSGKRRDKMTVALIYDTNNMTIKRIIGFTHEVVSPRDAASGLPTGKRQHKPFTITKKIDSTSVVLMRALVGSAIIPEIVIKYRSGKEENSVLFEVTLINVTVAGIRQEMPDDKYTGYMKHKVREHVSLCYESITWTHGNDSTGDVW